MTAILDDSTVTTSSNMAATYYNQPKEGYHNNDIFLYYIILLYYYIFLLYLYRYLPSLRVSHTVYPEDVLREDMKTIKVKKIRSEIILRKQFSPTKLNQKNIPGMRKMALNHCETIRKTEPFICGMSSSFHKPIPRTISREKQSSLVPRTTDHLRTKSAPDVRHTSYPHLTIYRSSLLKPRETVNSYSDSMFTTQPPHSDTLFQRSSTMTPLPHKKSFGDGRLDVNPQSGFKTACYSQLKVGDILSAKVPTQQRRWDFEFHARKRT